MIFVSQLHYTQTLTIVNLDDIDTNDLVLETLSHT